MFYIQPLAPASYHTHVRWVDETFSCEEDAATSLMRKFRKFLLPNAMVCDYGVACLSAPCKSSMHTFTLKQDGEQRLIKRRTTA